MTNTGGPSSGGADGQPDPQELLKQLQQLLGQQGAAAQPAQPQLTPELLAAAQQLLAQQQAAQAAEAAAQAAAQQQAAAQPPQPDQAALLAQLQQLIAQQGTGAQPTVPVQPVAPAQPVQPVVPVQQAAPQIQYVVQAAEPVKKKHTGKKVVLGITSTIAVLAVALAALVGFGIVKLPFGGGATTAGPGEVFLIAASDLGPDPFSTTSLAPEAPKVAAAVVVASSSTAQPASAPGLYGGSGDHSVCDPKAQAVFLQQNPQIALAFVSALNKDANVKLVDGSMLSTVNLTTYITQLTPLVLLSDTRVTNHGYYDGQPTTLQSVLEAGTAVMVDQYGVPRVKCNCGNPLLPPEPVVGTVTYTGPPWPGWTGDPNSIVGSNTPLPSPLQVTDINTGKIFPQLPCSVLDSNGLPPDNCVDVASIPDSSSVPSSPPVATATATPKPTSAPTAAPPPASNDPRPPGAAGCSGPTSKDTPMTVVNSRSESVDIWWYNESCVPELYFTLAPGESRSWSDATADHEWAATSRTAGDLSYFTVPAGGGTWTVS